MKTTGQAAALAIGVVLVSGVAQNLYPHKMDRVLLVSLYHSRRGSEQLHKGILSPKPRIVLDTHSFPDSGLQRSARAKLNPFLPALPENVAYQAPKRRAPHIMCQRICDTSRCSLGTRNMKRWHSLSSWWPAKSSCRTSLGPLISTELPHG